MLIRGKFPDLYLTAMLPALDEVIFERFERWPPQYSRIFRVMTSSRSIEQTTEVSGLGTFHVIPEGGAMRYDEAVPGFDQTYLHEQYGLGFKISRVMADDDRFGIIQKLAADLGNSARETIELTVASHFNNGFSGSYLGPDGVALFSTSHPLVKAGGVQANTLSTPADLDIPSLELALTDFRRMVGPSGKKIRLRPTKLVVPPELEFAAQEMLTATLRSDTPNNAPNAFKRRVGLPSFDEVFVWDYLSDPDAWFVVADPEDTELRFYWREKPNTVHDVDFDSRSIKTAMWFRFSSGWSSYYGVYGVPGA
ncbi:MAG: Mu-like prophage major head subunit gpT family protein [Rubrivivax sp.]|nr:Mu-like prophage major head subunit gpT family protein [Rubrivivax sp.]